MVYTIPLQPSPPTTPTATTKHASHTTNRTTPNTQELIATPGPYHDRKTINPQKKSKHTEWEIDIWSDTEVLVISDANFQDIRPNIIPKHWQLIVLPGTNTYDITKVIKQIPANTEPLIVVSAGIHDAMHRNLVLAKDTRDLCDLLDPSERNNLDIIDGIYNLTLRNNYIDPGTRHTTYIDRPMQCIIPPPHGNKHLAQNHQQDPEQPVPKHHPLKNKH